jgi:Kef-type K+ transport system membrane component KefB
VSGAATRKGPATRALHAVLLAGVGALLFYETRAVPEIHGGLGTIAAVGFLLLAGTLSGELVEPLGLPHLSGYLLAGIVAGPHVLALIDAHTVERLSPVSSLALSLIALAGGAELDLSAVRKGARSLGWAMLVQTVLVLILVGGTFVAARPLVPFARGLSPGALVAAALLWAVLAVSRSPSATLAILSQTRAKGPLMSSTLAFVMTSDVVVVVLLAGAMGIARPLLDPTSTVSLDSFTALGHEIVGSVAVGTTLGLILVAYLRLVGRQMLVVLLALGFGASEMLQYLLFDPLLTFMVAGLIVRNMSNQGEKFIESIEQTSGVVYVVFFATTGAHLDLPLLRALWPVALVLAASRAATTWAAARIGSRLAKDPPNIRRWGWSGLVSQAGLTLGLTVVIERELPSIGTPFRALAVATVAVNEIVGPVLFKLALDRCGETSREQAPSFPSMPPPPLVE